jgi:hypothetical protein
MSEALPGSHYCEKHQGNHSHYAPENCDLCRARAENAALAERADLTRQLWDDIDVGGRHDTLGWDTVRFVLRTARSSATYHADRADKAEARVKTLEAALREIAHGTKDGLRYTGPECRNIAAENLERTKP